MKSGKVVLFLLAILSLNYCTDPCEGVNCNDGTCMEGICQCDDGYEGDDCSIRKSEKFTGLWEGAFDCGTIAENGQVRITDNEEDIRAIRLNSDGLEISFDGITFNLDNTTLEATLNTNYTGFVVDTQTMVIEIPNNPGISAFVFGAGQLEDPQTLNIQLKVKNDDFGAAFQCEGTVTK